MRIEFPCVQFTHLFIWVFGWPAFTFIYLFIYEYINRIFTIQYWIYCFKIVSCINHNSKYKNLKKIKLVKKKVKNLIRTKLKVEILTGTRSDGWPWSKINQRFSKSSAYQNPTSSYIKWYQIKNQNYKNLIVYFWKSKRGLFPNRKGGGVNYKEKLHNNKTPYEQIKV